MNLQFGVIIGTFSNLIIFSANFTIPLQVFLVCFLESLSKIKDNFSSPFSDSSIVFNSVKNLETRKVYPENFAKSRLYKKQLTPPISISQSLESNL